MYFRKLIINDKLQGNYLKVEQNNIFEGILKKINLLKNLMV